MNNTVSTKIFKIINRIKACRAKTIKDYNEYVSINLSYGIHKNEAGNAVREYIELFFFSTGIKSKNNECVFTFKTMDELEKFLNENIEGYGVSNRTKSKNKT